MNLWCKCAYEIALIFLAFPDSLEKMRHDLRDTTEKIETLISQTTTVEKSADEGWLLKRASRR